jgi:HAD superfamily hydrolase (TIGR01450 family)
MNFRKLRAVLLDLDGVVYLEHKLIPGAAEAIRTMRARGLKVGFVTNNATATRATFGARLTAMGIPCTTAEVMNTSYAAARYLGGRLARGTRVFVFGKLGLAPELRAAGLSPVTVHTREEFRRYRAARPYPNTVVASFDTDLTWWELCAGHVALERGARFIACNFDPTYPVHGGTLPGTGSLVKQLEVSSRRTPFLVGKPAPLMFRMLLQEWGMRPADALVVGDRLPIDIAGGRAAGAATALVLTGIDQRRDIPRSRWKPHLVARDLPALVRLLPTP